VIVVTGKFGELCNRIFTFANVIAFAAENGLTVINAAFDEYAQWFSGTANSIFCTFPSMRYRSMKTNKINHYVYRAANFVVRINKKLKILPSIHIGEQGVFRFDDPYFSEEVNRIRQAPVSFLEGFYYLDKTNFVKHADTIRTFFLPTREVKDKIDSYTKEARKGSDVLIGVHIRHGDYKNFRKGLYYYTTEEYANVIMQITKLFPNSLVKLVICSDIHQDLKPFKTIPIKKGPGHFIEDLYVLANCDYIIGPPSTFSQWASFHGRVPRYVINYKAEHYYGIPSKKPCIEDFYIHSFGFGKYS